jgi:hypothetical protein
MITLPITIFFGVMAIYNKLKNIMKKVIRLTESDLVRLVQKVINEQQPQSKGQGLVNFKVGDKLQLTTHVDVYEQFLDVQVKSIRGGFGPGTQGPASKKNSMELDCILITDAENVKMLDNLNPKLKKGDSLTLLITDVNAPLLAYWKLLKGGKPIGTHVAFDKDGYVVGGKLSDIKKI